MIKQQDRARRQFLGSCWTAISGLVIGGLFSAPPEALAQPAGQGSAGRKVLILYYSRTGHTRTVATQIHGLVGGDLAEIQTVEPYPDDYDALVAQNVEEQRSDYKPPLRTKIDNLGNYDVIFIGSPLWNVRLTPPVRSFLSSHDLSGKTIAPFVTYIVSGLGRSRRDIEELCPDATILDGLAILGEDATKAETKVQEWLRRHANGPLPGRAAGLTQD
ncbi:flavodoxin [Mesorhizobium sp. M00.F.Ca.ET.216.01.1.1]|uniref:flavodoxin n=1 Tax=Mesorhizobium sp. M00.F.Ca.ET.216.01.1.1 TaxID=2500528 RepID=UPI000FD99CA9|nr:flavodoxin [Mesorhizobium sp. M00.F.Ca.ET.216.01.1.1]TGQ34614.1 flavodoxin [Mesorhizobium sp. M00.F.Ca.ET.216.01.1.1]TJW09307.1 MAG: flavodoxin [Mesorhizobium sp.]